MTTLAMLTTIIVALITAVIGPLLMTWFKNKLETKPTKSLVEEAIDLTVEKLLIWHYIKN